MTGPATPPPAAFRTGPFGGRFVAETLVPAVEALAEAFDDAWADPAFQAAYRDLLETYVGRPTPLSTAPRLSDAVGATVLLKREDLAHTGSHKINNCVGQALLARRMGKRRIIAETGAGQHGVATATVCARLGLSCTVYMGAVDVERQRLNVFRMRMLGATVVPVESGTGTLKDAINEALRDWVTNVDDTHYVLGSVMGPDPYPRIVRTLHEVIGREARAQVLATAGRLPDAVVACVGGGSNAMGIFSGFLDDPAVRLYGVEAAGTGLDGGRHAATMARGRVGIFHGMRSLVLQDDDGQIQEAHSISAGLDYPGVGPEHAYLASTGRAEYLHATDDEALAALHEVASLEGIVLALETAHAAARLRDVARVVGPGGIVLLNVSGRGDKDMPQVMAREGEGGGS